MSTEPDPETWDAKEAAAFLHCAPSTVNELRKRGRLQACGRSSRRGRWLYSPSAVRDYARGCAELPPATLVDDVASMIDAAIEKERTAS